jgi:hypothetical protein
MVGHLARQQAQHLTPAAFALDGQPFVEGGAIGDGKAF